ncbi:hypothetical protein [Roseibium sp. RKSG952]|uniref:hypothetical protein n=1 Tax=Roseibium sp. RKSG952 TaxID=2529384 RepID=UPI0012BC8676|nr:hypothetical protein [Roseibium sp. RKSG952]MTH95355.1 hypothetical protein [Roseibium sp. RKSG952]
MRAAESMHWRHWNPGLDNGEKTLGEVLETLPAAPPEAIPLIIRIVENPSSMIALPGAITLERHDAVHVLLGRGLTTQDEAFVIGFTMGATKKLRRWQERVFEFAATKLYPQPYAFTEDDLISWRLGVAEGRKQNVVRLDNLPLENAGHLRLKDLRQMLGIDTLQLRAVNRKMQVIRPDGPATRRLDLDVDGIDAAATVRPDGPPSDWKKERS